MAIPCDVNLKCCGIYLIRNIINNKIYIGQSKDIYRRWQEHKRSGQPEKYPSKNERDKNTPIHLAIRKYGIDNFRIEVLEKTKNLNERERYWIQKFHSTEKNIGYNISCGGQDTIGLKGEHHSQAKLTQQQVNEIQRLLKENQLSLKEISEKYNVARSTISLINQGHIWRNKEISYPLRPTYYGTPGSKNARAKFTEKQVLELRTLYSRGLTLKDIPKKYKELASDSAI